MRRFRSLFSFLLVLCVSFSILPEVRADGFVRGDVDGDGVVAIDDVTLILNFLVNSSITLPCDDAADVDDSGAINLVDALACLAAVTGDKSPPAPFPRCGEDPTKDRLGCRIYERCGDKPVDDRQTRGSLEFQGRVVEILPSGEVIREIAIHAGRRFKWNGRVVTRVPTPEIAEPKSSDEAPDVDEMSVDELAESLRGLAMYQGHEFIEEEPAYDLARAVKKYRALVNRGASDEELARLMPPLPPGRGLAKPGDDFENEENPVRRRVGKKVLGSSDERTVKNNMSYPHRTHIVFDTSGSTSSISGHNGSGSLIGRSTAMSVAHVFWNSGWTRDARWAPGFDSLDADSSPWGDWYRCYWVTIPMGYVIWGSGGYDYAVLDFNVGCNSVKNGVNSDRPGNTVGWLGWWVASSGSIQSRTGYVRGYPGASQACGNPSQLCRTRVWGDISTSHFVLGSQIRHNADTSGGMSGSAFYVYSGGGPYLVGMHRAAAPGSLQYNLARRFSSAVYSFMKGASSDY